MAKQRLDTYLTEAGLVPTKSKAQSIIMAGEVYINNQKAEKAGISVDGTENIEIRSRNTLKYVSRGGLKLERAVEVFEIRLGQMVCMDIGASTGGFTDCMLQNGAAKVYAVDVGYGQLAWTLRNDKRVVNMERRNIRYLTIDDIDESLDFISIDVSFISLRLVLGVAYGLLEDDGCCVCLIKPQFEAGRDKVGKGGVVRDKAVHKEVITNVFEFARGFGFSVAGLTYSPIKGPEGNIEYLMYLQKQEIPECADIAAVVDEAHTLGGR